MPQAPGAEAWFSTSPPTAPNYVDFEGFYFNGDPRMPDGYAGPRIPGTAPTTPQANYVAMGDSFSAGQGSGPFYPETETTTDQCYRSHSAYSQLLPSEIAGISAPVFVACGGAVTSDLYSNNHSGFATSQPAGTTSPEPAQLIALESLSAAQAAQIKLVTLTIGGNDLGFPDVMASCVSSPQNLYVDPRCQNKSPGTQVLTRLAALQQPADPLGGPTNLLAEGTNVPIYSWKTILTQIHALAPNAVIAVAGYPQLFDPKGTQWSKSLSSNSSVCQIGQIQGAPTLLSGLYLFKDEANWIASTITLVDDALKNTVATSGIPGAGYVAPTTFAGHSLCDSDSWINPISAQTNGQVAPTSLHPSAQGQSQGYAVAFANALGSSL